MRLPTERPPAVNPGVENIFRVVWAINARNYTPSHGSIASVLLEAHPCKDRWTALRSLRAFAYEALGCQGLWWVEVLAADEAKDSIDADELRYVAACWSDWYDGENPFKGRHRRVAA